MLLWKKRVWGRSPLNPNAVIPLVEYKADGREYPVTLAENMVPGRTVCLLYTSMPLVHPVSFWAGEYDPDRFFEAVRGLEKEPEGGKRCEVCFRLRLQRAAQAAAEKQFSFFTTTLTVSPLKNAPLLNAIGEEMGKTYGVQWLPCDFKKKEGYKRSIALSKEYDLYRQDYCGCVFSQKEREENRRKKEEVL